MAVRKVAKGENGYRLVWLIRKNGSVAYVSSFKPCCPGHVSMAARTLATISMADWMERRAA